MWCWSGDNGLNWEQTERALDMAAQYRGQLSRS